MAVTIEEKWESRPRTEGEGQNKDSAELIFIVQGTDDDELAMVQLKLDSPVTFRGLDRLDLSIERLTEEVWLGTINYGEFTGGDGSDLETGGSTFQFETGGGTQHITQSLSTNRFSPTGDTDDIPDHKGAIGVTEDGVDGVDIIIPSYSFSETHFLDVSLVTPAYTLILFSLTGRVNDALFKGFQPGECLFLGASGSRRTKGDWSIQFKFSAIPNATGLSFGGIDDIEKKGHDYLWFPYEDDEDGVAKKLKKTAIGAYVEKVYEDGDFSLLGLGVI